MSLLAWFSWFSAFWPCVTTRLNDSNEATNGSRGGPLRPLSRYSNQLPFNEQRTSSFPYTPALPIELIPRCCTTTVLASQSHPCAWPLRRYHDAHGAVRAMTFPHALHMHIRPCSFPLPPVHILHVPIVDKHPKDVRFSLDSLDRWQYRSSSQCRKSELCQYKSECHMVI